MPPGVPVASVTGVGPRRTESATQPVTALAMIATPTRRACLSGITEGSLACRLASRIKLILDLRAVTLELAVHPKTIRVVPDAAGEIGRDERIARRPNRTTGDDDLLVAKLARADADDAAMLRVDHRRLLQHRRGPEVV